MNFSKKYSSKKKDWFTRFSLKYGVSNNVLLFFNLHDLQKLLQIFPLVYRLFGSKFVILNLKIADSFTLNWKIMQNEI